MERLNLWHKPFDAVQVSTLHSAPYANILPLVKNKIVLDIACGEGYGAALLMRAGAKRVISLAHSIQAINMAKKLFSDSGAEYILADVHKIKEDDSLPLFDVVVAINTMEHVSNPVLFLESVKSIAKSKAIFYLTCSNDPSNYPIEPLSDHNHIKKYTFNAFQALTTPIFGDEVQWAYGCPILGFGTITAEDRFAKIGESWLEIVENENAIISKNYGATAVNEHNCQFFAGLWNSPRANFAHAVFPLNVDAYQRMIKEFSLNLTQKLQREIEESTECIDQLQKDKQQFSDEIKRKELLFLGLQAENEALRINLQDVTEQIKEREMEQITLQERYNIVNENATALTIEKQQLIENIANLHVEKQQTSENLAKLDTEKQELFAKIIHLEQEKNKLTDALSTLESEHNILKIKELEDKVTIEQFQEQQRLFEVRQQDFIKTMTELQCENGKLREKQTELNEHISALTVGEQNLILEKEALQQRIVIMTVPYYRYLKIIRIIPEPLKQVLRKIKGIIKHR